MLSLFEKKNPGKGESGKSPQTGKMGRGDPREKSENPAIVLKPLTAELKSVVLRQHVLPRYIFEQLISEPVLNPTTAEPRGTILGQVVLHNPHCQRTKEDHLHLIWIHDGQLRYGLVWRDRPIERYRDLEEAIHDRTTALAMMRTLDGWYPPDLPGVTSLESPICSLAVGQEEFHYRPPDALVEVWALRLGRLLPEFIAAHRRPLGDLDKTPVEPRPLETVIMEVEELLNRRLGGKLAPEDIERELLLFCQERRTLRERWQQYYDKWHAMPQIFIGR